MKILLVADRRDWAYDILAQSIKRHSRYEHVEIKYVSELRLEIEATDFSPFDVVYFFLWYDAMRYGVKIKGFEFSKTCVGIHSLSSWMGRGLNQNQASSVCNQFAAAGYISKEIGDLLDLERGFSTPNGIESEIFYPSPLPAQDELRVMWVGNPGSTHHGTNKGFHSIVKPVISELSGFNIHLHTAMPETPVSRNRMGDFYRKNHVLICASIHEGGPMPVVEALACGRPVISTEVGIVPEIVHNGINGLTYSRSRSNLRKAIMELIDHPEKLLRMSLSSSKSVSDRTAIDMANSYDNMFDYVYNFQRSE